MNLDAQRAAFSFIRPEWLQAGEIIDASAIRSTLLAGADMLWVVLVGQVDVFAVPAENGHPAGNRHHLFRVDVNQAIFSTSLLPVPDQEIGLLAVGSIGTQLLAIERSQIDSAVGQASALRQLVTWLDGWVTHLATSTTTILPPKDCTLLAGKATVSFVQDGCARSKRGVVWIKYLGGRLRWLANPALPSLTSGYYWPISGSAWIEAEAGSKVDCESTEWLLSEEDFWLSLRQFHRLSIDCIKGNIVATTADGLRRLQDKTEASRRSLEGAFSRLAAVMEPEIPVQVVDEETPLLAAARLVGDRMGIQIKTHPNIQKGISRNPLGDIAKASRFRLRQVILKGEWWQEDNGPLLGFTEEGRKPVALLPVSVHSYIAVDPIDNTSTRVRAKEAASLHAFAHMFYRPFMDRLVSGAELLRFGVHIGRRELLVMFLTGITIGLLGLLVPLATTVIVDQIIPGAYRSQLLTLSLALLVSAVAATLFQVTQSIALLRFEGLLDVNLQAAVWDRLLNLPVSFFRDYTAGDLGNRAMSINTIRQTLSGSTLISILSSLFSIFSFALLFYYDARLAWLAAGLVVVAVIVTLAAGYLQVRYQRELVDIQGRIAGIVLQLITGITKFRVAASEERAFVYWARAFSDQKRKAYEARTVANSLAVFNSAYPLLAAMAIFAAVGLSAEGRMTTGEFLGFNAAFSAFLLGALQMSFALISTLSVIPAYERAKPILQTPPETNETRASPGELSGEIEVSTVSFRYKENGPLVLKQISLHVEPGEFVALVGPSGSGKSSLLRLLLGFETPEAGAIYYNGQDLSSINVQEVRRQMGVVLQNGRLLTGTILENIIGSSLMTIDEAWVAAQMCGLDDDIKRMPMGMHTLVSEGGGTLSGGQRQRLLIARAIVTRPRILFFDEATSALDNRTQSIVSESLERLQTTRVVIAHRLSTIQNADRIFVIESGRIVQQGPFRELIKQPGLFMDLVRRQMTST